MNSMSVFYQFLERCRREAVQKGHKFRFKNKLLSLDATVIDLCLSMYNWAMLRERFWYMTWDMLTTRFGVVCAMVGSFL